MQPMLTVLEASRLLKIHPETCRKHIRQNKLKAKKKTGKWLIDPVYLENLDTSNQNVVAQEVRHKESLCQNLNSNCTSEAASGGIASRLRMAENEYRRLRGQQIKS